MAKTTRKKGSQRWINAGINTGAGIAANAIGNIAADKLGAKVNKKAVGGLMLAAAVVAQAAGPESAPLSAAAIGFAISGSHVLAQEIDADNAKKFGLAGVAAPSNYDDATPGAASDADYWAQAAAMAGLEDDDEDYAMLQDTIAPEQAVSGVALNDFAKQ